MALAADRCSHFSRRVMRLRHRLVNIATAIRSPALSNTQTEVEAPPAKEAVTVPPPAGEPQLTEQLFCKQVVCR